MAAALGRLPRSGRPESRDRVSSNLAHAAELWPISPVCGLGENLRLEMIGPSPDGLQPTTGRLLIELVEPLYKTTDSARVSLSRCSGHLADQAVSIASHAQERGSESRVFGVENWPRDAPSLARDGSARGRPAGRGDPSRLTQ